MKHSKKQLARMTKPERRSKPLVRRLRPVGPQLVEPPEELAEAWERLRPKIADTKLRHALLWVMHGASADDASRRAGVSPGSLNYWLKKLNVMVGAWASAQLMATQRRVASLASEEMERRLLDDPSEINIAALNFIAGTATDKLGKYERWERDELPAPSYASALEKLASALAEGKVDLRIEVTRREEALPAPLTIDVPSGA